MLCKIMCFCLRFCVKGASPLPFLCEVSVEEQLAWCLIDSCIRKKRYDNKNTANLWFKSCLTCLVFHCIFKSTNVFFSLHIGRRMIWYTLNVTYVLGSCFKKFHILGTLIWIRCLKRFLQVTSMEKKVISKHWEYSLR